LLKHALACSVEHIDLHAVGTIGQLDAGLHRLVFRMGEGVARHHHAFANQRGTGHHAIALERSGQCRQLRGHVGGCLQLRELGQLRHKGLVLGRIERVLVLQLRGEQLEKVLLVGGGAIGLGFGQLLLVALDARRHGARRGRRGVDARSVGVQGSGGHGDACV
jgi:hypothetical protein